MGDFGVQSDPKPKSHSQRHWLWPKVARIRLDVLATGVLFVGWVWLERLDLESRRFAFRTLAIGLALIGPFQNALPVILARMTVWIAACGVLWGLWYEIG